MHRFAADVNLSERNDSSSAILTNVKIGSSLQATNISQMALNSNFSRACAIEIRNFHQNLELRDPAYYLLSGINQIPPVPVIKPGFAEACLFRKVSASTRGTAGVLAYNIDHVTLNDDRSEISSRKSDDAKFVFMWCVPFVGATLHAVGVVKGGEVDRELFRTMESGNAGWFQRQQSGTCCKYQTQVYDIPLNIVATISDSGKATWVISVQ